MKTDNKQLIQKVHVSLMCWIVNFLKDSCCNIKCYVIRAKCCVPILMNYSGDSLCAPFLRALVCPALTRSRPPPGVASIHSVCPVLHSGKSLSPCMSLFQFQLKEKRMPK